MAKQTINIGSGELAGDGESLRSAFDKINDNFNEVYTGSGTTLGSDTTPALGGNLDLSGNDITGIGNLNITGNITATGSISASVDYSNLTSTPTTLAGYGIADAYTQTQVDTAITNATSSIVIQAGSTQSIDVVAADSTVLVDSVNGTLNATTLTGTLPAIDGSSLTGVTTAFSNITSTPTTLAGYGITDATSSASPAFTGAVDFTGTTSVDFTGATVNGLTVTETDPVVGAITGIVKADGAGNISAAVAGTDYSTFDGAYGSLTGTPTIPSALTDLGISDGTNGQVLTTDGSGGFTFEDSSGGGGSSLQSRTTKDGVTGFLIDGNQASVDITGFKGYALLKVYTSRAARVRIYTDDASRAADQDRAEGTDPTADAGVIAEVITTGAETVLISPGAFGFNNESTPTTTIPTMITNKSGSTQAITVTLTLLQLES